jgi:hypothetical protein
LFCQGQVQTVVIEQLHQQMPNLQQEVVCLGMLSVQAENVLQVQAAVF